MNVSLLLVSCALALCFVSCSARWEDGNDGVERIGANLPGTPIKLKIGAAPSDCAQLCYADPRCEAWSFRKASCEPSNTSLCFMKVEVVGQSPNKCTVSGLSGPPKLLPAMYRPLPLGTIKPQGWLKNQLQIQASGLSGNLPYFWADVMNSSWIGGTADGGLHERTPYWLNGFLLLAHQLENQTLIDLAYKYVDYIIEHQSSEGWLGLDDDKGGNEYWSKYFVMMVLRHYHEINSSDDRVLPAIMKFMQVAHDRLAKIPLGVTWSGARWQDFALSVHWMLDNNPMGQEQMLWDLAETLHDQGFNWKDFYENKFPTEPVDQTTLYTHGVNNGQALKSEGVWYRQSQNHSDFNSSYVRVQKLDEYHGQPSGIFACDEHLAGKMPSRGTELCTVVEAMFSYEMLFSIQGDPMFAERAEKLTYNALPATITSDMWAHQYLQQVNEMNAISSSQHVWTHDGPDSTVFGLAPNYGCCTANFNQGWPKFTQHLVMERDGAGDDGLVVAMYSPAVVKHTLKNGLEVMLSIETDYPFDDKVTINASCGKGMILSFRVPSWTGSSNVVVNGSLLLKPPMLGTIYDMECTWSTKIELTFSMKISVERGFNQAAAIFRGPLLYGLQIEENFTELRSYYSNSKDYSVTPMSPWNYAILLGSNLDDEMKVVTNGISPSYPPFSIKGAPVKILAKGRQLKSWVEELNAAAAPPQSPVQSSEELESITLIPFGATDLRISEFPVLDE